MQLTYLRAPHASLGWGKKARERGRNEPGAYKVRVAMRATSTIAASLSGIGVGPPLV
jgi:hypothetical protein